MKTKYGNFNTRVDFKIAEDFKKIALKLGKKSPDLVAVVLFFSNLSTSGEKDEQ